MLRIEIHPGAPLGTLLDTLSREHVNFTLRRWLNGAVHDVGRRVDEYQKVIITATDVRFESGAAVFDFNSASFGQIVIGL